jgi:hypothetical protein
MGELDARLALSGMRGDAKYSVLCDGDGSGSAAGLGTGSGEARLEALRFAWPGRRYENMFEGAIAGVGSSSAAIAIALLPRGGTDDWRPEAQLFDRTGGGASQRGNAPAETIADCVETRGWSGSRRRRANRPAIGSVQVCAAHLSRRTMLGNRWKELMWGVTTRQSPKNLPTGYRMLGWNSGQGRAAQMPGAFERSSVGAGGVSSVQVQPSARARY